MLNNKGMSSSIIQNKKISNSRQRINQTFKGKTVSLSTIYKNELFGLAIKIVRGIKNAPHSPSAPQIITLIIYILLNLDKK